MKFRRLALLAPLLVVGSCVAPTSWEMAAAVPAQPVMVAHRGASSEAPENTLAAAREAIGSRAGGIEVDVRYSKGTTANPDGVPVLMHDATVDRTTECTGAVTALTTSALAACNAGKWFSRGYDGEPVPTLYQFTKLVKDADFQGILHLELKTVPTQRQAALTIDRVHRFGLDGQTVFISFSPEALKAMMRFGWKGRTGYIFRTEQGWSAQGFTDLIPYGVEVTRERILQARADTGARISVGSDRYIHDLAAMGPDSYSVNYLDEAIVYTTLIPKLCTAESSTLKKGASVESWIGNAR